MELPYKKDSLTEEPYHYYLEQYRKSSAYSISERLQIPFCEEDHSFRIRFLGETYKVTHPNFDITHETEENGIYILEDKVQAKILLLRFLLEGDAAMYLGKLLSYRNLPWAEDAAYIGDIVMEYMKRYEKSKINETSMA